MEFSTRAAELMTLLESRITNFYTNFQADEISRVVSIGDGITRVYGLNEIQAGEMVEFVSGSALRGTNCRGRQPPLTPSSRRRLMHALDHRQSLIAAAASTGKRVRLPTVT
ncbi:hypothetical protein M0R45_031990 [Rubus argutus]|uniref:ATPase F1/V1/A1 complex alpha/beta subunit N-terminal domain-containing protein n=1 Tax=Rubus argutus TaxID=59490 RepID=A0AAW1WFX9_RUBAR